jgi:hypothetical protein
MKSNLETMQDEPEEGKELDELRRLEVLDDAFDEHSDVFEDSSASGGDNPSKSEPSLKVRMFAIVSDRHRALVTKRRTASRMILYWFILSSTARIASVACLNTEIQAGGAVARAFSEGSGKPFAMFPRAMTR